MSGLIRRGVDLFDPVTGLMAGYVDNNGQEQAIGILTPSISIALQSTAKIIAAESDIIVRYPLTHSLYGSDGSYATFARNNGSGTNGLTSVRDHEGYLRYCRTDEAAFRGARRVENLVVDSEGLVTGWTPEASTSRNPSANGLGKRYDRTTAAVTMNLLGSVTYETGWHALSFSAWTESGTQTLRVRIERTDTTLVATADIALTTAVKRFSLAGLIPDKAQATRVYFGIVSGSNVHFCMGSVQMERKPNGKIHPSEYVARGVAGAAFPFAGAGVDGVQYFNTVSPCYQESDNTVAVNVAPTGVLLPVRPTGIQHAPRTVQRFLWCSDFTNAAWTKVGFGTPVAAPLVDNPLGYGQMQWLPETASIAVCTVTQSWSGTVLADDLNLAVSFYVKRDGVRRWLRIGIINKANETIQFWYDMLVKKVGKIQTSGTTTISSKEITVEDFPEFGMLRVGMGGVGAGSGGTTPSAFVGLTDADGNTAAYQGVVGNGVWVGGAMFSNNDHPTALPNINTTAVSQRFGYTRVNPPWPAGLVNDFTVGAEITPAWNRGTTRASAFNYLLYWRYDASNRGGTGIRAGVFGGTTRDINAGAFAQDFYNVTSPIFDGTNITLPTDAVAWTSFKQLFGISSVAQQPNGGGSFLSVDGGLSYSTVNSTPTLAPMVNPPTSIQLGIDGNSGDHEAYFRDLVFIRRVLTTYERTNAGSYA